MITALQAQPVLTQKDVDSKTLVYYNSAQWDELIAVGEKALESSIDFFNLRIRLGAAYYKKGDYMSAIPHFEKALSFNRADLVTMEYLYYSYLFSGRESDVLALVYDMPAGLKKKLDVQSKFIYGAYGEAGYTTNSDFESQKPVISNNLPKIYNEQEITKDGTYFSLNLKHQPGKNVKVFHGYNNISVNRFEQILDQSTGLRNFDLKSTQNEYYLNINFNLGDGFDLTPAFHYLRVKYEDIDLNYDKSVNPWRPVFVQTQTTINDFVLFLSITKNTERFKLGFKNSISNLNKATQIQNTAEVIYFPFGNLNFYSITDATLFSNKGWGKEPEKSTILDQKIGFKTFEYLWVEAGYTFGDIYNFNESDAYIVFNNTDKYKDRITLNLISPVNKHIELSLRYQHYNQEVPTTYFATTQNGNTIFTKNTNHKIIGGIKWTF
jgi:tetratricopeptide (TPR) repeat protein